MVFLEILRFTDLSAGHYIFGSWSLVVYLVTFGLYFVVVILEKLQSYKTCFFLDFSGWVYRYFKFRMSDNFRFCMPREVVQENEHGFKILYEDGVVLFTTDSERIHWLKVESEHLVNILCFSIFPNKILIQTNHSNF